MCCVGIVIVCLRNWLRLPCALSSGKPCWTYFETYFFAIKYMHQLHRFYINLLIHTNTEIPIRYKKEKKDTNEPHNITIQYTNVIENVE